MPKSEVGLFGLRGKLLKVGQLKVWSCGQAEGLSICPYLQASGLLCGQPVRLSITGRGYGGGLAAKARTPIFAELNGRGRRSRLDLSIEHISTKR